MLILPGSNALSAFRNQRLLSQLQAVAPAITAVQARFYHFIDTSAPLSAEDTGRLDAMLTYGEPFVGQKAEGAAEEFFVIPRLGTISPWASKATDIAHNCGMAHVHRIERGVAYTVFLKGGLLGSSLGAAKALNAAETEAVAALLHDRMTEAVFAERDAAARLRAQVAAESRRIAATSAGLADAQQRLGALDARVNARLTELRRSQDELVRTRIRLTR
ncbi:MAG: phosphoribosylformylglycinamidine synthase, partial [Gammaproteobacteria bacterium]